MPSSPATLVAILVAARRANDRDLEREARQRLKDEYGIRLTFARPGRPRRQEPRR